MSANMRPAPALRVRAGGKGVSHRTRATMSGRAPAKGAIAKRAEEHAGRVAERLAPAAPGEHGVAIRVQGTVPARTTHAARDPAPEPRPGGEPAREADVG